MPTREQLEQAIAALEGQRAILGEAVVEMALAPLRQQLAALQARPTSEQRKQITVLFADVSGFTAMSEHMDAEEVRDLMNALWARLDQAILDHAGIVDKHIGDAVMALFGAPNVREDDPERAIRAALAMHAAIADFVQTYNRPGQSSEQTLHLQMRIGINTGPVVLGTVGTTAEYTAIGDTVNLASRLEHAAPVGGILISHNTYRHVRGVFDVQMLEPIKVKGKSEPVQVYVVEGLKPRAFRVTTRGVEGIETRMIGREAELRYLQEAFQGAVQNEQAQVISVVAEAGVGKSRLLHEFTQWLELRPENIWFFKARADQRIGQQPYAMIRALLAFRFEIQDSDETHLVRQKLEQGLVQFLGVEGIRQAHFIGHLVGFDFREASSPYLMSLHSDARQLRERAFEYTANFFAAAGRQQPVVIFLEDIHWADDGSLDMIEHVAQTCTGSPLLIVCITRPSLFERRSGWGQNTETSSRSQRIHTRLDIHPLSAQDSQELVSEILRKVPEIPPALQDLLVRRAEGNPFYLEEMIKVLIEDGTIVKGVHEWAVNAERLAEVRIPPTLTEVLQARLDGLPQAERETLQKASVVGRDFWDDAVAGLSAELSLPPEDKRQEEERRQSAEIIHPALSNLQSKELIFRRDSSAFARTSEYTFKHNILRDVTYESVLLRLRRIYHAQMADWLIEHSRERVGEYAGLIGEHHERAGQAPQAIEWYRRAGDQARDTYAPEAAINYYQKALGLLPPLEKSEAQQISQLILLCKGIGEVLQWRARFAEAEKTYETMRAAAEASGNKPAQAHAWNGLAQAQESQGDYRALLDSAQQAEGIAQTVGKPAQVEMARALLLKGLAHYRLGEMEPALKLGEQALALNTELNNRREMAICLNLISTACIVMGNYDQAQYYYECVLVLFQELEHKPGVMGTLNNLGEIARIRGDYQAAVKLYQDALNIAHQIGNRECEMLYLSNMGGARIGLGPTEYPAAEANLRQVIFTAETSGEAVGLLAETYGFLAEACLGQEKIGQALEAARQALKAGQTVESQEYIGMAWRTLGKVTAHPNFERQSGLALSADASAAAPHPRTCFEQSLNIFTETGMEGERAQTLQVWAEYELGQGNPAQGQAMQQEARAILARLGMMNKTAQSEEESTKT